MLRTKSPRRWILSGSILLSLLTVSADTRADGGLALDRFQPSPAGDRFFGVQGGDPGGHLSPRLMLLGDYGYRPLTWKRGDDRVASIVEHQLILHVAAGLSLWDRVWLFADMPVALINSGSSVNGAPPAPSGVSAGDLRPGARIRLLGKNRSLATLSLSGYIYVPTGKRDQYMSADEIHGMPALVLSGENDSIAYALNAGVDLRKHTSNPGTGVHDRGSSLQVGGAFAFLLAQGKLQIGPEVYGSSLLVGSQRLGRGTTNLEAILGARLRSADFVFGLAAGPGIVYGVGTPGVRIVASLAYAPAPAAPAPPPPADRDGDGISDDDDACPDKRGVRSSDPDKNGCPPDTDGDGIIDKDDACPEVKGVANDDPDENGCPPDTDGDGIRDDVDACPKEKGKPDTDPTKNGCPAAVRVTDKEIVILEQVQFKTGSAEILPASDDLLTQVANALGEHPEILKLEVQGHTDSRGSKATNQKLSKKRSAAVMAWLVKRGKVDASRLTSRGYGMEQPIADNDTDEGRQKNRRVQFKIIEKSDGKPEAE